MPIKADRMYADRDGIFDDECRRVYLRGTDARSRSAT